MNIWLIGIIALVISHSIAFYKGYEFNDQTHQLEQLRVQVKTFEENSKKLQASLKTTKEENDKYNIINDHNEAIINDLHEKIKSSIDNCNNATIIDGEFLRNLDQLR